MQDKELAVVEELERRLLEPRNRSSRSFLDKIIADDFFEIGCSGRVWTKDEIIESLLQEQSPEIEIDSVHSRWIGKDVVLITYRSRRIDVAETAAALRSSIWQRRENVWKVVFHQGTPAAP